MNPLNPLASWHEFAQPAGPCGFGFALLGGFCNAVSMRADRQRLTRLLQDCYPFPSTWPGPAWVGPFLLAHGRGIAGAVAAVREFVFSIRPNALESTSITTTIRGSLTCVNLSSCPFLPFRLPVVCSPTRRPPVLAWVPSLVRHLAQLLTTTSQNLRLSAVLLASSQATQALAADLAVQSYNDIKASRGFTAAGFLHCYACAFGPAQASNGREPCSRKS